MGRERRGPGVGWLYPIVPWTVRTAGSDSPTTNSVSLLRRSGQQSQERRRSFGFQVQRRYCRATESATARSGRCGTCWRAHLRNVRCASVPRQFAHVAHRLSSNGPSYTTRVRPPISRNVPSCEADTVEHITKAKPHRSMAARIAERSSRPRMRRGGNAAGSNAGEGIALDAAYEIEVSE